MSTDPKIMIGSKAISSQSKPFIIAEMSGNHNRSLDRALRIVEAAAAAGADALKLQTYTADTMTIQSQKKDFVITDSKSPWNGQSLHDLYGEAYTPWEWHEAIFKRCNELGLICFSTPFDETAVDFLETLNTPCYKIASFENNDLALIEKVARTGKPLIISTGMASISELEDVVRTLYASGSDKFVLLKCTSAYPAPIGAVNLKTIPHMRDLFDCPVGISDHTQGIGVAIASVAFGATVIEKHFTLSRADGGVDSTFSLEPHELQQLVVEADRAWQALGCVSYRITDTEVKSKQFRRSLYAIEDIPQGAVLDKKNIRSIRPGYGLAPKYLPNVLGRKSRVAIKRGTPLSLDLVE